MKQDIDELTVAELRVLLSKEKILTDLVLIYALHLCGNMGKTAETLGFASSAAVSNRIRTLERTQFDDVAIVRHVHSGSHEFTPLGLRLLDLAKRVVPALSTFVQAEAQNPIGIQIAAIASVWEHHRTDLKAAFEQNGIGIADAAVRRLAHTDDIVEAVRSRSADLGIITYPPRKRRNDRDHLHRSVLQFQTWIEEDLVMVALKSFGAGIPDFGNPKLLLKYPVVLLQKRYGIRQISIDPFLENQGIRSTALDLIAEMNNVAEIKEMVATHDRTITILPMPTVIGDIRFHWARIPGMRPRPISFVHRKGCKKEVLAFLQYWQKANATSLKASTSTSG
jgi:DNA-binding transcriptional LysR family regulator